MFVCVYARVYMYVCMCTRVYVFLWIISTPIGHLSLSDPVNAVSHNFILEYLLHMTKKDSAFAELDHLTARFAQSPILQFPHPKVLIWKAADIKTTENKK